MTLIHRLGLLLMAACFSSTILAQAPSSPATNPAGYWQTYDEVTNKPKSIVQVWVNPDRSVSGRIKYVYPQEGHDKREVCKICPGNRRNQPYFGMLILEKLRPVPNDPKAWQHGEILDPENGKVYSCQMHLSDNGTKMHMRGYVGISMFGRTQTWTKTTQSAIPKD